MSGMNSFSAIWGRLFSRAPTLAKYPFLVIAVIVAWLVFGDGDKKTDPAIPEQSVSAQPINEPALPDGSPVAEVGAAGTVVSTEVGQESTSDLQAPNDLLEPKTDHEAAQILARQQGCSVYRLSYAPARANFNSTLVVSCKEENVGPLHFGCDGINCVVLPDNADSDAVTVTGN